MGDSNRDQLVKICQVLGTDGLFRYLKKYGVKLDDEFYKMLGKYTIYHRKNVGEALDKVHKIRKSSTLQ